MVWYYKLIAQRPYLIIIAVAVFSTACIIVSLTTKKIPDFEDPTLGFDARGTSIGRRITAWRNLLEETRPSGRLVANPGDVLNEIHYHNTRRPGKHRHDKKKKKKQKEKKLNNKMKFIKENFALNKSKSFDEKITFEEYEDNDTFINRHEHWDYGKNQSYTDDELNSKKLQMKSTWVSLMNLTPPPLSADHISDGFFCDAPNKEYAHFAIQKHTSNNNETLLDLKSMLAICELEHQLGVIDLYDGICQKELNSNNCCRMWSIPNYIALLSNKTSCYDIDDDDIINVKIRLFECFPYYHSFTLSNDCIQYKCMVPPECAEHNAVYNILHYLADVEFLKLNDSNIFLNVSMIFLPIARSSKSLPFYYNIIQENLSNNEINIVAMDMGLKNALFDECLFSDSWLIGIGGLFIIISMWIYTTSLFITLMTVIAIVFSLGIAYFVYSFVYELTFFPFMNLLAVVVVVGIGADDAFIFIKIWHCVILDRVKSSGVPLTSTSSFCSDISRADTLSSLVAETLKHAALSMLVTSFTTASAFFASYTSSITAVQCFGIFAGTAVIANYCLMITWLPAAVSIAERITCLSHENIVKKCFRKLNFPIQSLSQLSNTIEESIISLVLNYSKLLIIILGALGILSGVAVLYYPKLQLPDSPDFKLFVSDHPFEVYDAVYKDYFWFDKGSMSSDNLRLPLRFVWGIRPVDYGNHLDPRSRGTLELDDTFNMSLPESQLWLVQFCQHLKNQSFYQMSFGFLLPNCFIENFITWMGRTCYDDMSGQNRTPCCEVSTFPYETSIFDACLQQSITSLYETPRQFFIPGVAGPKFLKKPSKRINSNLTAPTLNKFANTTNLPLVALVVEYDSTQFFTMSFSEMDHFVKTVESWFREELRSAPNEMKNGWFISDLDFYDLQETLSHGTLIAICMSMGVALLVLLFVTLNLLISFYAIITVTFTIFTTIAILILLGWKLNVLESIAVSSAIGLSVDFSLHYGVHYRFSPDLDRASSTRYALSRMIGPTSMAALTTGIAGGFMLGSHVLPYIQIGVFLLIIMTCSWIYATFFLMSILCVMGPQYGFGQFRFPKFRNGRELKNGKNPLDSNSRGKNDNPCTVSEQLLSASSSAAGDLVGSESHELEALTSNSIIKPSMTAENVVRPMNFERAFKTNNSYPKEQSPSTISSITVVMPDDESTNN